MRVFELLRSLDPAIAPDRTKIHLASHNGIEDPLDVYFDDRFKAWQEEQTKPNFNRPLVLALIQMPERDRWLFAGTFDVEGVTGQDQEDGLYRYTTSERPGTREMAGRLIVEFRRPGRASYLVAENWVDALRVDEIRRERLRIPEFPGYKEIHLDKPDLDRIVRTGESSWRAALSSVSGVYLITDDATGRGYVGSADGQGGIWERWASYSQSGHGGNRDLRSLLELEGAARADGFRFAILEVADLNATRDEVLAREAHWKRVLMTRRFGLNGN